MNHPTSAVGCEGVALVGRGYPDGVVGLGATPDNVDEAVEAVVGLG